MAFSRSTSVSLTTLEVGDGEGEEDDEEELLLARCTPFKFSSDLTTINQIMANISEIFFCAECNRGCTSPITYYLYFPLSCRNLSTKVKLKKFTLFYKDKNVHVCVQRM